MTVDDGNSKIGRVVAIPVSGGQVCMHFGHCERFKLFELSLKQGEHETADVVNSRELNPPPHEPGLLPRWLHEQGVNLVIAGGMGQRAQSIFAQNEIDVIVGVQGGKPEDVVRDYLDGRLQSGPNLCDH